jgi:hypothetical protein
MSDEQTIYISPDDDLTTIRERLEQITAKRLTMVIPPQTQLRSHVAWKLLYARARELGKEVIIVSSDPQIRSIAHAVKFKVAHSLETPPTMGTRPTSRLGHTSSKGGVKTRASLPPSSHHSSAKASSESHSTSNWRGASNTRPPRTRPSKAERHEDFQHHQQTDFEEIRTFSEEPISGEISHLLPFDASEKQYDFRIHPTPAIHPLSDQIEEPDLLLEDYTQAQDIRSAAREGQKRLSEIGTTPPTESEEALPSPSTTSQPDTADDLPSNITKQNSIVSLESIDTNEDIIQDIDANEHIIQDIEDIEDQPDKLIDDTNNSVSDEDENVSPPSAKPIPYTESEQTTDDKQQENLPQRSDDVRSQHKSSSNSPSTPPTPSAPDTWQLDEDALPAIEERQVPPRSSAPLQARISSVRSSKKLSSDHPTISLKSRTSAGRRPQASTKSTPRPIQQRLDPATTRPRTRQQATHGKIYQNKLAIVLPGIILLIIAIYLLVYYGPTANVMIGIATQHYSQQVTLTAKVNGNQAQDLPAQQLSKDFLKSGIGTATGSQEIGTTPAQGIVIFTYDGSNPNGIIIPNGSIITTSGDNPIQFATTAEVLVPPSNQSKVSPLVSIQAVKPGEDGNVDTNAITVIPKNTLNSIAQAQNPPIAVSELKLSVVNEAPTSGGGTKTVPAVTSQDLTTVKNNLFQQLQGEINVWQQQLSNTGAIGTPQITTTLASGPKVNDIATNGTFPATIKATATVLLVHTADLQKAAIKQLNAAIKNDKSYAGETILTESNPTITINQLKLINGDANSITFTFNATVQTGPRVITKEYIQQLVMGKSVSDARTLLINTPKVKTVDITVSPDFMPWVTHWNGHINVIIHPAIRNRIS